MILQCSFNTYITSNCVNGHDDASVTCCELIVYRCIKINYFGNIFVSFAGVHLHNCIVTSHLWSNPYDGMVRLTNGKFTSEGLVEVYCNGQWGTVCDDGFSITDANTVCKQLGYSSAVGYDHLITL